MNHWIQNFMKKNRNPSPMRMLTPANLVQTKLLSDSCFETSPSNQSAIAMADRNLIKKLQQNL